MKRILSVLCVAFIFAGLGHGQGLSTLLLELNSDNAAIRMSAEKELAVWANGLPTAKAASLEPEINAAIRAVQQESTRKKGIQLLSFVSVVRGDSSTLLRLALPEALQALKDSDVDNRRAAALLLVNLKPDIPEVAMSPLIDALEDEDQQILHLAAAGLTQFCPATPVVNALGRLLRSDSKTHKIFGIQAMSVGKCTDSELLEGLRQALADSDSDVLVAAVQAIKGLGPHAAEFKPEVERLAGSSNNPKLAEPARAVLNFLR